MEKINILVIVPKDNHDAFTPHLFELKDQDLAERILREQYPYGTHEIIEATTERFTNFNEFESWCLKNYD